MIDGSVLQSAQRCFETKSRVVVKMVVRGDQRKGILIFYFDVIRRRLLRVVIEDYPQQSSVYGIWSAKGSVRDIKKYMTWFYSTTAHD